MTISLAIPMDTVEQYLASEIAEARKLLTPGEQYDLTVSVPPGTKSLVFSWAARPMVPSKPGPKLSKDGPG